MKIPTIAQASVQNAVSILILLLLPKLLLADFTNSIGMRFVKVPAGSFYMGSCLPSKTQVEENRIRKSQQLPEKTFVCSSGMIADRDAAKDELPQHSVRIPAGFHISAFEVNIRQFKLFLLSEKRKDLLTAKFIATNRHSDDAAISYVSWNDANDFATWLNKKEGVTSYRLPTEAEWEYAARAGTKTIFSWGNDVGRAGQYAWYSANTYDLGKKFTNNIGQKLPNPWKLYDMHGNAWEWVQDYYDPNYYANSPQTAPLGPGSGRTHVIRGGGWVSFDWTIRSATRSKYADDFRSHAIGFRLVRSP